MNRYPRAPGPWRPQGAPYYLDQQRERMGLPALITEHPRVKDNRQLNRISGLTSQVCTNYFQGARHGDSRGFAEHQLATVRAVLVPCEAEIAKTHAIAAASVEMVDEAYAAFGIDPPTRNYRVVVASEPVAPSVEIASLMAEVERLTAENASLNQQVEQLTAPASQPRFSEFDDDPHIKTPSKSRHPAKA